MSGPTEDTGDQPTGKSSVAGSLDALLLDHRDKIQAEIDRVEAMTKPLRAQRDAIVAKMQPMEDEARALAKQFIKIEQDHSLFQLKMDLGKISRALGGKTLSSGGEPQEGDDGEQVEGEEIPKSAESEEDDGGTTQQQ